MTVNLISSDVPTFNSVRDNELISVTHGAGLINQTRDNCLNEMMVSNSLISDIIIIPTIPSQSREQRHNLHLHNTSKS